MTEAGISRDANERVVAASEIMAAMMEFCVPLDRLYLDPLLLPFGVAQRQAMEAMEAVAMFKQLNQPPLKKVVGLSNIYDGCLEAAKPRLPPRSPHCQSRRVSTRRSRIPTTRCRWLSRTRTRPRFAPTTPSRSRFRCRGTRFRTVTLTWTELLESLDVRL